METTRDVALGIDTATGVQAALFRSAPIFRNIENHALADLAAISKAMTAAEGTILSRQGEPASHLLVLLDGRIALETLSAVAATTVVEIVPPGGHSMLSAVLGDVPALMTARAIQPSRLIGVDAAGLRGLLYREPSIAAALLRAEAAAFGALVRQVCDLKLRTTAQRLGCYLLELTDETAANTVALRLPFDKRLLAARLGCRQENLSRAFAALRRLGVETHGARVILHDIAGLRSYALCDC